MIKSNRVTVGHEAGTDRKTTILKCKTHYTKRKGLMKKTADRLCGSDENVKRWYDNLARASRLTADCRIRRLDAFCRKIRVTPAELVRIGKEDPIKAENFLLDHVSWMMLQKYAPSYIEDALKGPKSWLTYNYIDIRRKIKIANANVAVTLQDEQVPTNEQLELIMNAADPRTRATMALMAFSGLRPKVMGNDDRSDGLLISDIPDLDVGDGTDPSFARMPATVIVRPQLSKAGHRYFTFLTSQGCRYLLGYLRTRIAHGEKLSESSPVITKHVKGGCWEIPGSSFLSTKGITHPIRKAIWSVTRARPYVLRAYFDTQLLMAESNGTMTHAYRQFFMGHTGDMEARYTTNKGRLTEQMSEDMRMSFARSESFLDAGSVKTDSSKKAFLDMWQQQAKVYGIDPAKVKITIDDEKLPDNDGTASVGNLEQTPQNIRKIEQGTPENEKPRDSARPYTTKIITGDDDLLEYTSLGWETVQSLGDNRMLMRIKNVLH